MKGSFVLSVLAGFLFSCSGGKNHVSGKQAAPGMLHSPAGESSAEPCLYSDRNGVVYLSWIEKTENKSNLKFSKLEESGWSPPTTIASGTDWFVNWADYPAICADGKGNLIAHYLEKSDTAKFTYDIKYVWSQDSGRTWSTPETLHEDGVPAEHGFVSMAPFGENFILSWLDGRNTVTGDEHSGHEGHHGEMTVRAALLDKKGKKINEWELDSRVCDCCQTSVANTDDGPIVVYRDRSAEEVRDMSIVRWVNGNWTEPEIIHPDNWKITGCPVNGPRADAIGNKLVIAWFSMAEKKGEVKIIFSEDGGQSFQEPIRIDEGMPIGRVAVKMLDEKSAMVTWMEGSSIKAVNIRSDGKKGDAVVIASSSESRSAGFPQMVLSGNKLIFAWTDDKIKSVKTATWVIDP